MAQQSLVLQPVTLVRLIGAVNVGFVTFATQESTHPTGVIALSVNNILTLMKSALPPVRIARWERYRDRIVRVVKTV